MRILVLGANGMLGHTVVRVLAADPAYEVTGTVRNHDTTRLAARNARYQLISGVDVECGDALMHAFQSVRPQAAINCIGVVKQVAGSEDPLRTIPLNAVLPHRLAALCDGCGARLIHVSTDCVFSGARGRYSESDAPDAIDLYGRSKLLGEVDYAHALTLRTSIIGPELSGNHGLIGWFLSQHGSVKGYRRAIFSGLPTVELATVMRDVVLPRVELRGLYHVAADAISKLELLQLVGAAYGKPTTIVPDDHLVIDRSLDGGRFSRATGYTAPPWPELIRRMHDFG